MDRTLRVFLPRACLRQESGRLIGCIDHEQMCCCVTGFLPLAISDNVPMHRCQRYTLGIVGTWTTDNCSSEFHNFQHDTENSVHISMKAANHLTSRSSLFGLDVVPIVILYDSFQFAQSIILESAENRSNAGILKEAFRLHRQYVNDKLKPCLASNLISVADFTRHTTLSYLIVEYLRCSMVSVAVLFLRFFFKLLIFISQLLRYVIWLCDDLYNYFHWRIIAMSNNLYKFNDYVVYFQSFWVVIVIISADYWNMVGYRFLLSTDM